MVQVKVDATGEVFEAPDDQLGLLASKGGFSFPAGTAIPIRHSDGAIESIPVEQYWAQPGILKVATPEELAAHGIEQQRIADEAKDAALQEQYGSGLLNMGQAFAEGAARGTTLNISDALAVQAGMDPTGLKERAERNPIASTLGEVAGAIIPAILTGGESAVAQGAAKLTGKAAVKAAAAATPTALAESIGAKVGAKVAAELGEGFSARLAAGAARTAAEGALAGVGGEISARSMNGQDLLDPGTMDEYLMAAGQGALIGGAFGGVGALAGEGLSAAGRAAKAGYGKAKAYAGEALEGMQAKAGPDLTGVIGREANDVTAAEQRLVNLSDQDLEGLPTLREQARAKLEAVAPEGRVLPGAGGERADAALSRVGDKVKAEAKALGVSDEVAESSWKRIENGQREFQNLDQTHQDTVRSMSAKGDEFEQLKSELLDHYTLQRRNDTMRQALATDRTAAAPDQLYGALKAQHDDIVNRVAKFTEDDDSQIRSYAKKLHKYLKTHAEELDALAGRVEPESYAYHSTPAAAAEGISQTGLQPGRGRSKLHKDVYFSHDEADARKWHSGISAGDMAGGAGMGKQPAVVLRTSRKNLTPHEDNINWDLTSKDLGTEKLEYFDPAKQSWRPVKEFDRKAFQEAAASGMPAVPQGQFSPPPKPRRLTHEEAASAFEILDQSNRLLGRVRDKIGDRSSMGIGTFSDELAGTYESTRQILKNPSIVGERVAEVSGRAKARWSDKFDTSAGYRQNLLRSDAGGARTASGFDTVDRFDPAKVGGFLKGANSAEGQLNLELVGRGIDNDAKLLQHFADDIGGATPEIKAKLARVQQLSREMADDVVSYRSKVALAKEYAAAAAPALKELRDIDQKILAAQAKLAKSGKESLQGAILEGAGALVGTAFGGITGSLVGAQGGKLLNALAAPVLRNIAKTGLTGMLQAQKKAAQFEAVHAIGRRVTAAGKAVVDRLHSASPYRAVARTVAARAPRDTQEEFDRTTAWMEQAQDYDMRAKYLASIAPPQTKPTQLRPDLDKTPTVHPLAQRKFLRAARAAMDPAGALEDLGRGAQSKEAADALRNLYPRLHDQALKSIIDGASSMRRKPSMRGQQEISLFFGHPVHFTMEPRFVQYTQSVYQQAQANGTSNQDMLQSSQPQERARQINSKAAKLQATGMQRLESDIK